MHYSLVDIKLFVAIADAGNVSRGAAHCFLAPSSASLRIKQLEESLGTRLFSREARGVSLTRAGQVMLEHCRRCLAELEQMHANLAPYAQGVKSHLTLFANSTAIASYLPEDLSTFLLAYPAVRVSLEERLSHEIVAAVAEGRADIGVVTWGEEHPDVTFWPYHEDELIIVAPVATELGQGGKVRFVECLAHPIISLTRGTAIHTFLVGKAAALGYPIDVRIQVAGFSADIALVCSGAGIAIVPRSVMRSLQNERVKTLSLQEPWAVRHLTVCARSDEKRLSIHAQALLHQLRDSSVGSDAV